MKVLQIGSKEQGQVSSALSAPSVSEWLFDAVEPWNHSSPRPVGQNPFGANFRVRRYSLLAAQHALEMFRRALPISAARSCLDQLSNRLTKIAAEARKLRTR